MTVKQWINFITLTIIWGASFLWIKLAVEHVGPMTIVAIRLTFALVTLAGFVIAQRPGIPTRRQWGRILVLGLISSAIPWMLIAWSEIYIDSALATVLNATVPLFTIICAQIFIFDDRMTRNRVIGLLIGFVGIIVLVGNDLTLFVRGGGIGVRQQLAGQAAMLLAACLYGVANVYARAKFRDVSPLFQTFYTLLVADAVMWVVAPTVEAPFTLPPTFLSWVAIAWLGVLGAGISYLIYYNLLHQIGPTRVATVTYAIPVVGVTVGVVFLGEALKPSLIVGTVLIVSGVWWVNRR